MRVRVVVRGRVQGVGFRWFVREHARALGLSGRVTNRPDGTVDVEAEGDQAAIEKLMGYLRRGPAGAAVDAVDAAPADSIEALPNPFAITR
jgi:acylphosphatase